MQGASILKHVASACVIQLAFCFATSPVVHSATCEADEAGGCPEDSLSGLEVSLLQTGAKLHETRLHDDDLVAAATPASRISVGKEMAADGLVLANSQSKSHKIAEIDALQAIEDHMEMAADGLGLANSESKSHKIAEIDALQATCGAPAPTDPKKWSAMKAIATVLQRLEAPWNIHAGLLLGLVRSCSIFDYDIDIAIERQWMQDHHQELEDSVLAAGFKPNSFDTGAQLNKSGDGYEEKFFKMEAAERKYRSWGLGWLADRVGLIHTDTDVPLDLFTVERHPDHYTSALFVWDEEHPGWENSKGHSCRTNSTGTETFSWLGVDVKIPVPFEDALISQYGRDYMTPVPWQWDVSPFTIGSCI